MEKKTIVIFKYVFQKNLENRRNWWLFLGILMDTMLYIFHYIIAVLTLDINVIYHI